MWVLLGTVFVASLLGSLHCVGMCGPFALLAGSKAKGHSLVATKTSKSWSSFLPTAAYSVGRLATYSIVGLVFGTLGMALNRGVKFSAFQQTATYTAGGLMIAVGVIALLRQLGWKIRLPTIAGPLQTILQKNFKLITDQPPLRRAFLIGSFSCLMPCGWLYTFAIVAAGTGSPVWGAVVMAAFWSGTVPIMAALMLGFNKLGLSFQRRVPFAMASMVIVIGVFTIAYRAPIVIGEDTKVPSQAGELISHVQSIDQSSLPCCEEGEQD